MCCVSQRMHSIIRGQGGSRRSKPHKAHRQRGRRLGWRSRRAPCGLAPRRPRQQWRRRCKTTPPLGSRSRGTSSSLQQQPPRAPLPPAPAPPRARTSRRRRPPLRWAGTSYGRRDTCALPVARAEWGGVFCCFVGLLLQAAGSPAGRNQESAYMQAAPTASRPRLRKLTAGRVGVRAAVAVRLAGAALALPLRRAEAAGRGALWGGADQRRRGVLERGE